MLFFLAQEYLDQLKDAIAEDGQDGNDEDVRIALSNKLKEEHELVRSSCYMQDSVLSLY